MTEEVHRLHSHAKESVLKFKDVNFLVGKDDNRRNILTDVSGVVRNGRVLAIMGPSGAGKTTLISALTLDAYYGTATGAVKLNGKPMTQDLFEQHCYVVKQQDKHWPFLTCRETLRYAAQLYDVVANDEVDALVDQIVTKMGLDICANTRNARLSGGQARRLSIGIALIKQPQVLFLDEPTSGLDAAAATNIMNEIVRVAKDERLICLCTIHQPSTKVYNGFDQVMVMSRGRIAYSGDVQDAPAYFDEIGYPLPEAINPAEYFLDLVNSDFSDEAAVNEILNSWEERAGGGVSSHHHQEDEEGGALENIKKSFAKEIGILFSRHFTLVLRDPILYVGRCFAFLITSSVFALVYLNAREFTQDQAINKFWLDLWMIGVPSQLGVVAVYSLNDEFKSLLGETKNGMVSGLAYVMAKSVLVLPVMYLFSLFVLIVPIFVISDAPWAAFPLLSVIFACTMFQFESLAEALSVWFDDPIIGMLQFMNYWFGAWLFGGFLIPSADLYWPFTTFYHIFPWAYFLRPFTYVLFRELTFEPCDPATLTVASSVCIPSGDGLDVLEALARVFPVITTENTIARDMAVMVGVGVFFKFLYIVGVLYRTSQSSKFEDPPN